jgi:signal transduction histidine kinase
MNTKKVSPASSEKEDDTSDASPDSLVRSPQRLLQRADSQWRIVQRWLVANTFASPGLPVNWYARLIGYLAAVVLQVLVVRLVMPFSFTSSFAEVPALLVVLLVSFVWGATTGILAMLIGALLLVPSFITSGPHVAENAIGMFLYVLLGLAIGLMASQTRQARMRATVEQKDANTARQQLRDLLMQSPIPVSVTLGPEHRLEFVSPLTQHTAGKRTLLGLPIREAFPEYASQGVFELLDQVYTTGESLTIREMRVETLHHDENAPTSIEQYFNVVYQPLRSFQGTVEGVAIFNVDITEQVRTHRQMELLMREREQERDQLSEVLAQRGDLERQTRESLQALLVLAEAFVSLPASKEETREASSDALVLEGVSRRLVALIRSVLNCKRVSITVLDPRTQELRSSAVVGLSPEQERLWRERRPGFHLSDQVSGSSIEAQFLSGNVVILDMRDPLFAAQPNPYGIRTMLLAPMHIGTRLIGVLALDHGGEDWLFTDSEKSLARAVAELAALILERERLLEERAESQANMLALQQANQLKDEFIGIAGHELRTPLTTIKASVQLASRQVKRLLVLGENSSPETEKLLSAVQTHLDRAERQLGMQNRLVNDLLDMSRIETGRLELHPTLTDLAALVRAIIEDQHILTPERRILFEQHTIGELLVLGDADRLRQVVTNYLSNALKYSVLDQPIFVRMILLEGQVLVEVEDRGPGLSEDQQQRIWERFYRVPGVEVKSGSGVGLGLGLHISRMIIERHGGKVGVQSTKGHGSTFWLTLPLAE